MTNEEKACKIIGGGCNKQNCSECGGNLSVAEGCVEFRHLKEMAEWKEQQMIEKACKWLKDNANDSYLDWYDWEKCRLDKDELLYDFREAMEGDEK